MRSLNNHGLIWINNNINIIVTKNSNYCAEFI
uniref:Uncharacterized protein n=1 Tax=Myoviridae sp. ct8ME27 TaxID=2826622 RepID=A0A8S5N6X8_9CAUD|nr:MAG TPA: hypothetical protein [Myoviridae sp. ct8ME27]